MLGDHAGQVDLEEPEVAHRVQHVVGAFRGEQLRTYGDAPGLRRRQVVRSGGHGRDPNGDGWTGAGRTTRGWPERVIPAPDRAFQGVFRPQPRHAGATLDV